jgi:SAM-dependent methyltransferase
MKPTKIPCDYLAREHSQRATVLFTAIRPYLVPGMTYLDIGCGTAPLTRFIDESFPPARYVGIDLNAEAIRACSLEYPHHTWLCVKCEDFPLDARYDVIVHTGVNARRFNDAQIHGRILDGPLPGPSVVLIESGDYQNGPSDTREIYDEIRELYRGHGFISSHEQVLVIDHFPVPIRRHTVFIGPRA